MSCHNPDNTKSVENQKNLKKLTIALAGNANVGKSVIFNNLTGLHQHVGNWPGKTVKKAEGTLVYGDYKIDIIDLPGIYSLSTYSLEEKVSREYIAKAHPDTIINVMDATSLERNLFFTLQLLEMEPHLIVALNQMDIAEKKGIKIDLKNLSKSLGVPVVETIGVKAIGLQNLILESIKLHEENAQTANPLRFGNEVEKVIEDIINELTGLETFYPLRWIAIKLLEGDDEIQELVNNNHPKLMEGVSKYRNRIEVIHGHDVASVITSERYAEASRIAANASKQVEPNKGIIKIFEDLTSHQVAGYLIMFGIILGIFFTIFSFGDSLSEFLGQLFDILKTTYFDVLRHGPIQNFIWDGIIEGIIAGTTIALPYIVPFFIALSILEDTGYLARVAFLMDSLMHKIGLHGKGFIPLMLGFGCNVPACLGCSIMETEREKLICAFVASLIPCAARSVVIMGLVASYVGFEWALLLYLLDFALIFILGRVAFKALPGEPVGLIMEIPSYKWPTFKVTAQRTWFRLKDFVYEAFPVMIAGNLVIFFANAIGLIKIVEAALSPVTIGWLGLPAATGVVLIFGILRKELTLILLASIMGTKDFSMILTPVQMFVFAFVVMIYVPCIATIAALVKEFGPRIATIISVTEIFLAIILGGLLYRFLWLFSL